MVRLRAEVLDSYMFKLYEFQFQDGAIKGGTADWYSSRCNHFNSKMVRLRATNPKPHKTDNSNFNSKMVRLRVVEIKMAIILF